MENLIDAVSAVSFTLQFIPHLVQETVDVTKIIVFASTGVAGVASLYVVIRRQVRRATQARRTA